MREKNDSSANHGGMRSAKTPKNHFEREQGELGKSSDGKYATEFGNPEDLTRSTNALADYAKRHRCKH